MSHWRPLLSKLGGIGETTHGLAYRLYSIYKRKKWAEESLAYNGLVITWPELLKLVRAGLGRETSTGRQREMF
jgi:putative DNA methylase